MNAAMYVIIGSVVAAMVLGGIVAIWLHPKSPTNKLPKTPAGKTKPIGSSAPTPQISEDQLAKLREEVVTRYEQTIQAAAARFEADLSTTSTQMGDLIKRMTTEIITEELVSYRQGLETMRTEAMQVAGQIQAAIESQNQALATGMEAELKAQNERMATMVDTKLADIVSSYILESLGNKVDLGAQGQYLFAMLEEHKDDIKQELTNDA